MRFVGVRELRNRTGEVLEAVRRGERVVLTKRGKPFAVVARLHEDELEGFILEGRGRRNLSEPSLDFWNNEVDEVWNDL
ncbi:MAG: type II toxin-antitoxin system prevent-host-death family antitoxin [Candidatus Rokubacteria bacterium]|nr:type II toxin-antitoxin system prevent-host-death family antitoxin [Candidatus Rokubacteria bacterium]